MVSELRAGWSVGYLYGRRDSGSNPDCSTILGQWCSGLAHVNPVANHTPVALQCFKCGTVSSRSGCGPETVGYPALRVVGSSPTHGRKSVVAQLAAQQFYRSSYPRPRLDLSDNSIASHGPDAFGYLQPLRRHPSLDLILQQLGESSVHRRQSHARA